jgi:hypothetical protein
MSLSNSNKVGEKEEEEEEERQCINLRTIYWRPEMITSHHPVSFLCVSVNRVDGDLHACTHNRNAAP